MPESQNSRVQYPRVVTVLVLVCASLTLFLLRGVFVERQLVLFQFDTGLNLVLIALWLTTAFGFVLNKVWASRTLQVACWLAFPRLLIDVLTLLVAAAMAQVHHQAPLLNAVLWMIPVFLYGVIPALFLRWAHRYRKKIVASSRVAAEVVS